MKKRWKELLSPIAFRGRGDSSEYDERDPFQKDYDRLISSAAVRRLKDKTQVFPLEESDFVRTRLTHSLEVSAIGRSLGLSVEKSMINSGLLGVEFQGSISSLLATAGLVHDLGNPPFGHFGENAIQKYFLAYFKKSSNKKGWIEQEIKDLINFDGNVQTFRILRKLHFLVDENSYNLTFPTLATIMKYPSSSIKGNKKRFKDIKEKKFGYFVSEADDYKKINKYLNLNNCRHPLVFLLEAADDIAYLAADIEDAVKLKIIDFDLIDETFREFSDDETIKKEKVLEKFKQYYEESKLFSKERLDLAVKRFKVLTQGILINRVVKLFLNELDPILKGKYKVALLESSEGSKIAEAYKSLMPIVYENKGIIHGELTGWKVIHGLLEEFVEATKSSNFRSDSNSKEGRLYNLISASYRFIYEEHSQYNRNIKYNKIQLVLDFISGMTDSYAVNLYRRIMAIRNLS